MTDSREQLAVSLAGLANTGIWSGGPREAIAWAGKSGLRGVQLDGAMPGMRARELDRSARKDLGAAIRRADLLLTGIDLWIPSSHFVRTEHIDRAMDAVSGTIELASDLGTSAWGNGGVVSLELPQDMSGETREAIDAQARLRGVLVADHAWKPPSEAGAERALRVGLDPAGVIASGDDPVQALPQWASSVSAIRLCDLASSGRVEVGDGKLDVGGYQAMTMTLCPQLPVVIDLRNLRDPAQGLERAVTKWSRGGLIAPA